MLHNKTEMQDLKIKNLRNNLEKKEADNKRLNGEVVKLNDEVDVLK